ncbi:MAG: TetR/AcrR family transcriptional regulator [Phycisphaerae bacterium]|nr:TetR/AcrR family transcriptional regulator [Phycisphaerae bacterium]
MEKTLPRKQRENLQHREEILAVAVRLFSQSGFHTVSMQDIAKESEFAVGTLYNFFQSKEQLFIELMKTGVDKFRQFLIPILESDKEEADKLSEFIQAHLDLIENNLELVRLYMSQYGIQSSVKPMLKDISAGLEMLVAKKLERIITTGMQKHTFRCVPPDIVALSLRATLQAFVLESSENFDKTKARDGLSKIEEFFLTSLLKREAGC